MLWTTQQIWHRIAFMKRTGGDNPTQFRRMKARNSGKSLCLSLAQTFNALSTARVRSCLQLAHATDGLQVEGRVYPPLYSFLDRLLAFYCAVVETTSQPYLQKRPQRSSCVVLLSLVEFWNKLLLSVFLSLSLSPVCFKIKKTNLTIFFYTQQLHGNTKNISCLFIHIECCGLGCLCLIIGLT